MRKNRSALIQQSYARGARTLDQLALFGALLAVWILRRPASTMVGGSL